jgi:hypothetical protein
MTFRLTLTTAVLLIISVLAGTLLYLQFHTANLATEEAANSAMDTASMRTLSLLKAEIVNLSKVLRTLSAAPSLCQFGRAQRSGSRRDVDQGLARAMARGR